MAKYLVVSWLPLLTTIFFASFLLLLPLLLALASEGAARFLLFFVAAFFLARFMLLLPLLLLLLLLLVLPPLLLLPLELVPNLYCCLHYYRSRRYVVAVATLGPAVWLVVFVLALCLHNCFCFAVSNFRCRLCCSFRCFFLCPPCCPLQDLIPPWEWMVAGPDIVISTQTQQLATHS